MAPSTQYSSWHIVGAQSILILKFNRRKIKDFSEYCIEEPSIKICNYQRQICAAFLTETGHINFQALQEPPSCKACSIDIKLRWVLTGLSKTSLLPPRLRSFSALMTTYPGQFGTGLRSASSSPHRQALGSLRRVMSLLCNVPGVPSRSAQLVCCWI